MDLEEGIWAVSNTEDSTEKCWYGYVSINIFNRTFRTRDTGTQTIASTHSCSMALNTMDCAVTKQLGSTWPSSPQIFAAKKEQVNFNMGLAGGAERHEQGLVNEKLQFKSTRISWLWLSKELSKYCRWPNDNNRAKIFDWDSYLDPLHNHQEFFL